MAINDIYGASKDMKVAVLDYMNSEVWRITARKRYQMETDSLKNLLSIAAQNVRDAQTQEGRDAAATRARGYITRMNELTAEFKERWESRPKYVMGDHDKALYDEYIAANSDVERVAALAKWFSHYGLEINAKFASPFLFAMGGLRAANDATVVRSGGKKWLTNRTSGDLLKVFYRTLCEKMVERDIVKPVDIPSDIETGFAPKKRATLSNGKVAK